MRPGCTFRRYPHMWKSLTAVPDLVRRLNALEARVDAAERRVELQLAAQQADYLNAYEKVLAVQRKMTKRLQDAGDALEVPGVVDRRFKKAQIRARRLGKVAGGNGVSST